MKKSKTVGGREEDDSAYDFLYVDLNRIGVLLSHFGGDGILRQLTRETIAGSASGRGLDLKLVTIDASEDESKGLTRTYDPQWLIPLLFLDKVQGRLKPYAKIAKLGDLVLTRGSLFIVDTALLQSLYAKASLQKIAYRKGMERATESGVEFDDTSFELELDMLVATEPQVQMYFDGTGEKIWSTLRPDGLITPASELAVKHGAAIAGEWYVLGIKDADLMGTPDDLAKHEEQVQGKFEGVPFAGEAVGLSNGLRRVFGRPFNHYGLTPLLIFRKLGV